MSECKFWCAFPRGHLRSPDGLKCPPCRFQRQRRRLPMGNDLRPLAQMILGCSGEIDVHLRHAIFIELELDPLGRVKAVERAAGWIRKTSIKPGLVARILPRPWGSPLGSMAQSGRGTGLYDARRSQTVRASSGPPGVSGRAPGGLPQSRSTRIEMNLLVSRHRG
jgi:hypothetical protein